MCLALPGKQHFGKPPADGTGFLSPEDDGAAPSADVGCLQVQGGRFGVLQASFFLEAEAFLPGESEIWLMANGG